MLALAYLFSSNRRAIRIKTVVLGLALQFLFAIFVLRFSFGRTLLAWAGVGVNNFLEYSFAGSQLVFGELGRKGGQLGMVFAFQVLPTVIFISAFFAVLYHYGIMQFIIRCRCCRGWSARPSAGSSAAKPPIPTPARCSPCWPWTCSHAPARSRSRHRGHSPSPPAHWKVAMSAAWNTS